HRSADRPRGGRRRPETPGRLVSSRSSVRSVRWLALFSCGQRDANDLLLVARENAALRERRMRPDDIATARRLGRLQDMGTVDLLVALRRKFRQDQVALVVEDHETVALWHEEGGAAVGLLAAGGRIGLPKLLTRVGLEAAQLTIGADAVDVTVL